MADALEALKAGGLVEEEPAAVYAPCLGAAVKVYMLRITERSRDAARQTAANLPEKLTREIKRLLRLHLCDLCSPHHEDVQRPKPIPRRRASPHGLSLTPLDYLSS